MWLDLLVASGLGLPAMVYGSVLLRELYAVARAQGVRNVHGAVGGAACDAG